MFFRGVDNQTVELRIHGYQFQAPRYVEDANWLRVFIDVKSKFGWWQSIDPSLTTSELKELVEWFEQLSKMLEPDCKELTFIEPNLSFHFVNRTSDKIIVRIKFDLESRPVSALEEKEYYVDCLLNNDELREISSGLAKELEKFPVR